MVGRDRWARRANGRPGGPSLGQSIARGLIVAQLRRHSVPTPPPAPRRRRRGPARRTRRSRGHNGGHQTVSRTGPYRARSRRRRSPHTSRGGRSAAATRAAPPPQEGSGNSVFGSEPFMKSATRNSKPIVHHGPSGTFSSHTVGMPLIRSRPQSLSAAPTKPLLELAATQQAAAEFAGGSVWHSARKTLASFALRAPPSRRPEVAGRKPPQWAARARADESAWACRAVGEAPA